MIAVLLPAAARHDLGFALTGKGGQVLDDLERALDKLEAYRAEKKKLSLAWSDAAIAAAEVETWKSQWRAAADKIWPFGALARRGVASRSEEHTSELQSLMRISYAVFCLTQKKHKHTSD